jgi:hypothetical protein
MVNPKYTALSHSDVYNFISLDLFLEKVVECCLNQERLSNNISEIMLEILRVLKSFGKSIGMSVLIHIHLAYN